jgi:hypothetical protein
MLYTLHRKLQTINPKPQTFNLEGKSFAAAFGRRSMRDKLAVLEAEPEDNKLTTASVMWNGRDVSGPGDAKGLRDDACVQEDETVVTGGGGVSHRGHRFSAPPRCRASEDTATQPGGVPKTSPKDIDRVHSDVRVEHNSTGWVVTSAFSKNFTLEPNLEFKTSQLIRTAFYEAMPPSLGYVVCVLTEMIVFGHTLHESMCCASARMLIPFPCPGPLRKIFITVDGNPAHHVSFWLMWMFWFPIVAVYSSEEVRHYIEPLELAPMIILHLCRVFVVSCKYALLPTSYVGDVGGKMYQRMKYSDLTRTLVANGWNEPKHSEHGDMLRMELENACLEADVDLIDTEVNLGSTHAAMVVRMRARGVGVFVKERANTSPAVVSGKELLAALMDTYIGRAAPVWLIPSITLIAVVFALVSPVGSTTVSMCTIT